MTTVRKLLFRTLLLLVALYLIICTSLYFFQEKLIFFPTKLPADHKYKFKQPFQEMNIATKSGHHINGLLFTTDSSKGLLFFLHGNAAALDSWGRIAKKYTRMGYDFFILDYPGYGKSDGEITNEQKFLNDIQDVYTELSKKYTQDSIVIVGYSIGSGPAAMLASANHPRMLVLQAPYYSLTDMMRHKLPIYPTFLLNYKLNTSAYLKLCKMPVVIFHGDEDEVIYYGSSLKLQKEMKEGDTLITLRNQTHDGFSDNDDYLQALNFVLNKK